MAFVSDDGVSAIEPVAVGFGNGAADAIVRSRAPTQLGIAKPYWVERHGDAEVDGFGPYEPPIGMRQGIPAGSARAAGRVLDRHVRAAVDDCLKQSER